MKTITQGYKNNVKLFGREIDSKITYTIDGDEIELGAEQLNSVNPHYNSQILKSVMKQLDIDSNEEIPVGTEINCQFGVKVDNDYEYINYGNYIVYSVEKQEDTRSYKIVCYDKMLYAMKEYEKMNITYPITIKNYINAICNKIGLTFANASDTFANYDREIQNELYLSYSETTHDYTESMQYTFRDVLDELAQVTASTICINEDTDELEIRYINDTEDTIDEEYLKDVNVNFGEKYGPVNSIVLSRAGDSDKIYLKDDESIEENGLCEINISENQIMNFNDRADYLPDILDELDGLEYYLNDFSSTGITYYEVCDKYNVEIGENTYSCVMFNDDVNITQGLEESLYTDMPEETETDYTKADKTDRKINQTYIIVDKQNQIIQSVVNNVSEQNDKISQITQTVDQIESQIVDIPTITTESSGTGSLYLSNLANTILISLRIHPTNEDIIGLLASNLITVREGLKSHSKGVTFLGENDKVYYSLPDNLYYLDNETYDEFIYDGKDERAYVIRRVEVDEHGNKSMLETPYEEEYPYQDIVVEEGNYNVFMQSYPSAYIYVKAMIKNDYTDFFATSYEVDSKITQTADSITSQVAETYETKAGAETQYSQIKQTTDELELEVGKKVGDDEIISKINLAVEDGQGIINLVGNTVTIDSDKFTLDADGRIEATGGTIGGYTISDTSLSVNVQDKYTYTSADLDTLRNILQSGRQPTAEELDKYDIDGNGVLDSLDLLWVLRKTRGYSPTAGTFKITGEDTRKVITTTGNVQSDTILTQIGIETLQTNFINCYSVSGKFIALYQNDNPAIQLDSSDGNITCVSLTQTSQEKYKKNFEKLENALDIIKNTDIYKYNLDFEEDNDKKHIGLVIGKKYKYSKEITSKENDGVDIYSMVSVCFKAIKEQQEIIEKLEKRISILEKESDK